MLLSVEELRYTVNTEHFFPPSRVKSLLCAHRILPKDNTKDRLHISIVLGPAGDANGEIAVTLGCESVTPLPSSQQDSSDKTNKDTTYATQQKK